jgi:hypothetical protein
VDTGGLTDAFGRSLGQARHQWCGKDQGFEFPEFQWRLEVLSATKGS